jgi:hypothetical protein
MAIRKITGMYQREGSTMWWLRIIIPTALRQEFYDGRTKIRMSLNTTDTEAARAAALAVHAEHAETFRQQMTQLRPAPTMVVSAELAELLGARLRARILAADDVVRFDQDLMTAFLSAFPAGPVRYFTSGDPAPTAEPVSSDGLSPLQLDQLTRVHNTIGHGLTSALTRGQWQAGEACATGELRLLGLAADWSKNRPAVVTVLRSVLSAWLEVGARNLGSPYAHPAGPRGSWAPPAAAKQRGHPT